MILGSHSGSLTFYDLVKQHIALELPGHGERLSGLSVVSGRLFSAGQNSLRLWSETRPDASTGALISIDFPSDRRISVGLPWIKREGGMDCVLGLAPGARLRCHRGGGDPSNSEFIAPGEGVPVGSRFAVLRRDNPEYLLKDDLIFGGQP